MIKEISILERCSIKYRTEKFHDFEIEGSDHPYLFCVCHHPGIQQDNISKHVVVNKSNVARTLCKLEKLGYIKREGDLTDRRILRVYPTSKALEILPKIRKIQKEWEEYLFSELSKEEQEEFSKLLKKVYSKALEYTKRETK